MIIKNVNAKKLKWTNHSGVSRPITFNGNRSQLVAGKDSPHYKNAAIRYQDRKVFRITFFRQNLILVMFLKNGTDTLKPRCPLGKPVPP